MRQVAAVGEVQSHELVTGVEHCEEYGCVGLRTRVGLHVGPFGTEYLLDALDGEQFALVHHLATAVVAFAGIALGVLIGEP